MSKSLREKLEDLRSLECLLMTRHREEQVFNLETFGPRDYNPTEPTAYSQAATGLGGLLDAVEDIVHECFEAEAEALVMGDETAVSAAVKIDFILSTLDESLGEA